jgi:kinesin family protein 11
VESLLKQQRQEQLLIICWQGTTVWAARMTTAHPRVTTYISFTQSLSALLPASNLALLVLQVFGCDSKQERVYKQAIVPIVQEVLDGFNCTIFAYGQTGTGKTYTMEGGPRNSVDGSNLSAEAGVIPRAIKQIFDAIECNEVTDSSVKVSFMELYNEELTDLLSPGDDKDKRLRLLEDRSGVVVQGLEEMVVKNAAGE